MCVETVAGSDVTSLTPSMLRAGNEETEEKVEEDDEEEISTRASSSISKL